MFTHTDPVHTHTDPVHTHTDPVHTHNVFPYIATRKARAKDLLCSSSSGHGTMTNLALVSPNARANFGLFVQVSKDSQCIMSGLRVMVLSNNQQGTGLFVVLVLKCPLLCCVPITPTTIPCPVASSYILLSSRL